MPVPRTVGSTSTRNRRPHHATPGGACCLAGAGGTDASLASAALARDITVIPGLRDWRLVQFWTVSPPGNSVLTRSPHCRAGRRTYQGTLCRRIVMRERAPE